MTGLQLKAQIALYLPETLASGLADACFANAFRSLSYRLPFSMKSDVTGLAVTATTLPLPVLCLDNEVETVKINGEYIDEVFDDEKLYSEDNELVRYYVMGRDMYFTAPIGYSTVTLSYKAGYAVPADGATVILSEPMIKIFTLLYIREYYQYVLGLVAMKRESAPDVVLDDVQNLLKNINSDIDHECSFFSV